MFTVLDPQGVRLDLNFGVAPANPAPFFQVSAADADVQDFEMVWNGRTLRITWTETRREMEFVFDGTLFVLQPGPPKINHMQMALAVPRKPGPPGYNRSYEHPSSALVRATLFNGATNFRRTALPNLSNDPSDGYGWGRLNLRQSLSPLPPVTFFARGRRFRGLRIHRALPFSPAGGDTPAARNARVDRSARRAVGQQLESAHDRA